MLKKLVHILFALLILLGSIGMTISEHYCGTSLKSISVNSTPDNCCEPSSDCCHNESFTIKIENNFLTTTNSFDFNTLTIDLTTPIELIKNEDIVETSLGFRLHTPPPLRILSLQSRLENYLL